MWQAASANQLRLVHMGTRVLSFGDADEPCSGQTLWADRVESQAAGVAWDWIQVRRGVVALADPLGMVTNLRLMDSGGGEMSQVEAALHLNRLVHALPWQSEVERALHEPS